MLRSIEGGHAVLWIDARQASTVVTAFHAFFLSRAAPTVATAFHSVISISRLFNYPPTHPAHIR